MWIQRATAYSSATYIYIYICMPYMYALYAPCILENNVGETKESLCGYRGRRLVPRLHIYIYMYALHVCPVCAMYIGK